MHKSPLFDRIDTFILPVRNYQAATEWYAEALGLEAGYSDPEERLTVLALGTGSSLTLWEQQAGRANPQPSAAKAFPIFATDDAAAAREALHSRGVRVDELQEGPGVRYFTFYDVDGNRLEACEVVAAPLSTGT
jgi:catechol 2,3-dioxygenase-like lactoylglutathione lyase family enzyme